MKINYEKKYKALRKLAIDYMIKKIIMDDFVCGLYDLDWSIEEELKKASVIRKQKELK